MADATILDRVREAAPLLRGEAAACEDGRRLTPAVVDALTNAGVFRMAMSRAVGGPELSPLEQLDVIEEVASADGSAGWCAMINSDGGYGTAFLEPLDLPTSVIANPSGQAVVEPGGYRVTGRWSFASGSTHAAWFFFHAIYIEDGEMQPGVEGLPRTVFCAVPAAEVEVHDTWHTTGLCGTASGDVSIDGVFVPEERTFSLLADDPVDPSPLYRWRWMFFVNMAGVPLGIARSALAEAKEVAHTKVTMPTFALAQEDAVVQAGIGRAQALVGSARAYVHDTVGRMWDVLLAGDDLPSDLWTEYRLALTHAAHSSKAAVGLLYEALGTTGVYRSSVLDRHLRDTTTLAQHILTQTKTYTSSGRVLLGLEPLALAY
jgi:alkylation response protein AidB-like acyl-CoA dehydrogenase